MYEQQRQEPVLVIRETDEVVPIVRGDEVVISLSSVPSKLSAGGITHSDAQVPTRQRDGIHLDTNIKRCDCAGVRNPWVSCWSV